MLRLFFRILFALSFARNMCAEAVDKLLLPEPPWTLGGSEFMANAAGLGFVWTSQVQDSARVSDVRLTCFGNPIVESVVRFQSGNVSEITMNYYARGDAGELDRERFEKLVRTCADAITAKLGKKFVMRGRNPANAVKADGLMWETEGSSYLLEYSFTREVKTRGIPFRAEFIRLRVTPPGKKLDLVESALQSKPSKFSGTTHVKKNLQSGDVWLGDLPMVDQGQKGYCVVASTERVMRYYGQRVDANELAQMANSDQTGTSHDAMFAALKKLSVRFKMKLRAFEQADFRAMNKLIADYNRSAKRQKLPELPDQRRSIDMGVIYQAMDLEVLREVRLRSKGDLARFERLIQTHIDEGNPLLWTVMLGLVSEPGIPQRAGGHMRVVIGYNRVQREVLFSDSWGAGHELKRMSLDDAWTICTGLILLEPL